MKRSFFFIFSLFLFVLISTNLHAQSSGLLLGVNVFETNLGLQVTSTIPNTPAVGKLYSGDTLRFMTAYGHPVYSAQRLSHLEKAKRAIGTNREAFLEILRNGNRMFFQISFVQQVPVAAMRHGFNSPPPAASSLEIAPAPESEARRLFGGDDVSPQRNDRLPRPNRSGNGSHLFD